MFIDIARDFSETPAGRTIGDGSYSGERFREELLIPKLVKATKTKPLVVSIDGLEGYASSFLEEAFGGVIRNTTYTCANLREILQIKSAPENGIYRDIIWRHIEREAQRLGR